MSSPAIVFEERVRIPAGICNLQEFRRWAHSDAFPETGRVSYLAGEVDIDMSPEELTTHNQAKTDVTGDLRVLDCLFRLVREPSPAGGYWYTLLDRQCPT